MPSIKDYDHKKKHAKKARRRPGREHTSARHEEEEEVVETSDEASGADETSEEQMSFEGAEAEHEEEGHGKVHIDFPYSDLIRARVPKAFDLAETVAEEWVNNGDFRDLQVGPPLARMAMGAGLRRAKKVERKLEETGVLSMARMGFEFAKSKLKK